ncbi:hypothetical protein ABZY19_39010 [Streptomyces sp. NPDC006475]|uniref:hypothetical protein n=1 Tax=Streptomyces sp. NPDC006475 TaxID=3155719 RepID=UPI0033AF65ED
MTTGHENVADRIVAEARKNWTNNPEVDGGADAFDQYISVNGIEAFGPLYEETYRLANVDHPIAAGAGEAAPEANRQRAQQLWQEVLPALERYADTCRTARYTGWSEASEGAVRRMD